MQIDYNPKRKRRKGLCIVRRCKCASKSRFCSKHRHQFVKEANPARYYFELLRSNARRRKHDFLLTFQQFVEFCERTKYLELKGRGCGMASIDRINPKKGYSADNIQIMEFGSNCRKRFIDDKIRSKTLAVPEIDISMFASFGSPITFITHKGIPAIAGAPF